LGLQRLAKYGQTQPFDLGLVRDAVLADTGWVRGVGDLGLLTWFAAECAPETLEKLFKEFDFDGALREYPDGRQGRTGGLAWFLAGISHAQLSGVRTSMDLTDVAVDAYHLLLDNQGESGIFGSGLYPSLIRQVFWRRFGSFDDQAYAIYALATFAKAFKVEEPLAAALNCANSVRALQGELGQWWFLYDKRAGRVANRYPVLSQHQDGIAPVGFLALSEATGQSFYEPIYRGLSWIAGTNEVGNDLRNLERGLIWGSIGPAKRRPNYWEAALSLLNISFSPCSDDLNVYYEARPDHFGWLLYAFSRFGLPKTDIVCESSATQ
jgi:hypothetical protein